MKQIRTQQGAHIERRLRNRAHMLERKARPCADCGGIFPSCCMDFHHVEEGSRSELLKKGRGSMLFKMEKWGRQKIDEELDKCVVLCSNCHRIRHHAQEEGVES